MVGTSNLGSLVIWFVTNYVGTLQGAAPVRELSWFATQPRTTYRYYGLW